MINQMIEIDVDKLYKIVGGKIREQRDADGVSQTKLGDEVNLLRTSISNIEAGRQRPPLHLLYQLCIALDLELSDVLPSKDEIRVKNLVSIKTVNGVREVPPKAAEMLNKMLKTKTK